MFKMHEPGQQVLKAYYRMLNVRSLWYPRVSNIKIQIFHSLLMFPMGYAYNKTISSQLILIG
jgi:hypothetical protein